MEYSTEPKDQPKSEAKERKMSQEQKWLAYVSKLRNEHDEEITRLKAELEKERELRSELWAAMANARYLLSHTSTDDLSWIDNLLKKSLIEKAKDL